MRYGILLGWGPRTATLYARLHNDLAFLNTFTCICLTISRNNLLHFKYVNFTLGFFFSSVGGVVLESEPGVSPTQSTTELCAQSQFQVLGL